MARTDVASAPSSPLPSTTQLNQLGRVTITVLLHNSPQQAGHPTRLTKSLLDNSHNPSATGKRTVHQTSKMATSLAGGGAGTSGRPLPRAPPSITRNFHGPLAKRSRPLVGTFEENILNNRLEPIRTVDGYVAEVRASCNSKQPSPIRSGLRVSFYSVDGSFPYLGQLNLGQRGYKIPKKGTLQVTLFNPNGTLVKLFLLHYDLTDMPANSQTFLRQRTMFQPIKASTSSHVNTTSVNMAKTSVDSTMIDQQFTQTRTILCDNTSKNFRQDDTKLLAKSQQQSAGQAATRSRIKYLIQLNIVSSKSGRIYLNKDLRIFVSKKVDLETASQFTKQCYELKAFDEMPSNPKYFSR